MQSGSPHRLDLQVRGDKKKWPLDLYFNPNSDPYPCSIALGITPKAKGALQVYQLTKGDVELSVDAELPAGIKCSSFGASSIEDRHLATGDYKGKLAVYDLERVDTAVFEQQAHASIINDMDGCGGLDVGGGAPELVTGGRDGCVRLWDTRVQEPVLALEPGEGQPARDCWTVAFGNSFNDEDRCGTGREE